MPGNLHPAPLRDTHLHDKALVGGVVARNEDEMRAVVHVGEVDDVAGVEPLRNLGKRRRLDLADKTQERRDGLGRLEDQVVAVVGRARVQMVLLQKAVHRILLGC